MSEQRNGFIMWGILICLVIITISLLIIALKPVPQPQLSVSNPPPPEYNKIIQLGSDRIAIVDNVRGSYTNGWIVVFDYDDKNVTFKPVGTFDYAEDFYNLFYAQYEHGIRPPINS